VPSTQHLSFSLTAKYKLYIDRKIQHQKPNTTAIMSAQLTGFPTLKPAFVIKANIGAVSPVGM
jgi:hypothetical protein